MRVTGLAWTLLVVVVVAVLLTIAVLRRRRRRGGDSAYGHWQRGQTVLWRGRPVTVLFDYAPYLKPTERRRVNVHTIQESGMGERSLVGFCHDDQEDRTFKLSGVHGPVLLERTREELPVESWVAQLLADAPRS